MKDRIKSYFNGNYLPFYKRYLSNLKKGKGAEYQSLCCFHDEKNPSLSINIKSGRYYCHGCNAKGDIFNFYGARHELNGNFPAILNGIIKDFAIPYCTGKTTSMPKSRPGINYVYTDLKGTPVHRTVKVEPKGFFLQGFINGNWVSGLKDIKPVLYRLPEVIKAKEVIIVEGEKDADNLAKLGFTATTCPMGAGKWREHYNSYFKDKNVVILPDNDDPGRKHAQQIAWQLQGLAKSVKVIELPDLPDRGDVSDFLNKNTDPEGATERLGIIIDGTPEYVLPEQETRNEPTTEPRFEFIHNAEILANLHPIEWQIRDILVEKSFYYDFGDPGSFKTFIALDRLLCIAAGIDYHGHRVKQGSVFYIAGEGQQGLGRRIAAWHIAHKTNAKDTPFFLAKTPTQLMDPDAVDEVRQAVDALAKEYGPPAVLHIDTLARNFGEGDENTTKDMNRVIQNMDVAFGNEFCRGITHHSGHTNKDRARGSIALHGAADEAFRASVTASQQVLVKCRKMKDAPSSPAMLFDLNSIKLPIADQYDESFTLTLAAEGDEAEAVAKRESSKTAKTSGSMKSALTLLDKMYVEYEKNLDGRQSSIPKVAISDWRDACVEKNYYRTKSNFNRALESMRDRKLVHFDEDNAFVYSVSIYLKYFSKRDESDE